MIARVVLSMAIAISTAPAAATIRQLHSGQKNLETVSVCATAANELEMAFKHARSDIVSRNRASRKDKARHLTNNNYFGAILVDAHLSIDSIGVLEEVLCIGDCLRLIAGR